MRGVLLTVLLAAVFTLGGAVVVVGVSKQLLLVLYASWLLVVVSLLPFLLVRLNPLVLLFLHILTRWVLDSFPEITYAPLAGPLSGMKTYTIAFVFVCFGYLYWRRQLRFDWLFAVIALASASSSLSPLYHGNWTQFFEVQSRWTYLWTLIVLIRFTLELNDLKRVARWVALAGLYPLANIAYTVITQQGFVDGGVQAYIGTYSHQSDTGYVVWTLIPVTALLVIYERSWLLKMFFAAMLTAAHVAIFLTAYRSMWIGVAVYWTIVAGLVYSQASLERRVAIGGLTAVVVLVIVISVGGVVADRMTGLISLVTNPGEYIDTRKFKRKYLLSGRIDILNASLIEYRHAPLEEKFVGLGPGSVNLAVQKHLGAYTYAHNEYLSALVENGLLGFCLFVAALALVAKKVVVDFHRAGWPLILFGPVFLSVLLTALSTMPFRDMRGMLLIGLTLGVSLFASDRCRRTVPTSTAQSAGTGGMQRARSLTGST